MRVHVCFVQNDLMNNETKTIADGIGLLNEGHLFYQEDETNAKHSILFTPAEIVLERISEVSSRTVLLTDGNGECVVTSPYGVMKFTTKLQYSEMNESHWKIHYSIFSEDEQFAEMELEWKIEKLA